MKVTKNLRLDYSILLKANNKHEMTSSLTISLEERETVC